MISRITVLELMIMIGGCGCLYPMQTIGREKGVAAEAEQVAEAVCILHVALLINDWSDAQILLDAGIDPYQIDTDGHDAFYYAQHNRILLGRLQDYVWNKIGILDNLLLNNQKRMAVH